MTAIYINRDATYMSSRYSFCFGDCTCYGLNNIIDMYDSAFTHTDILSATMTDDRKLAVAILVEHANNAPYGTGANI
jgi:hypothetical protein